MTGVFGKYRGKVINNVDPLNLGRLQISCAAVFGESVLAWAMPCSPYAGYTPAAGGVGLFLIPPNGSNLWIEFEGGDTEKPIWVGGFWTAGKTPVVPALPTTKVLKTEGVTIRLDDLPGKGGLTLEVGPPVVAVPVQIALDVTGISISCGSKVKITLDAAKVTVNDGALEVI